MMPGQTSIDVPELPEPDGPCDWCGDWDALTVVIEPARFGKAANGVRVMKRRPIVARACRRHAAAMGLITDYWDNA